MFGKKKDSGNAFVGLVIAAVTDTLTTLLDISRDHGKRLEALEAEVAELQAELDDAECCGECAEPCGACEPQDGNGPEPISGEMASEPLNCAPAPFPYVPPPPRDYLVYLWPEQTFGYPSPPAVSTVTVRANHIYLNDGALILNDGESTVAIYGQGQWQKVLRVTETEEKVA